ncbi:uncharacterized protein LOC134182681 [Corticium candelabrum]|uniref:uncharacterized protein LOC134182681 n=1 Tax=Corticium candelabrum TaxID=121492 RepID=UPI002E256DF6|nr:uncharacterized protein LOC134182681 [Corticium candelabrum]
MAIALCSKDSRCCRYLQRAGNFLANHYLAVGLVLAVLFGSTLSAPGAFFASIHFQYVCIPAIFLITGLKLKADDLRDALKAWRAWIWGTVSIMLVTPIAGIKLSSLLPVNSNITANGSFLTEETAIGFPEFRIGFQVFCVAPCTISAGIIMVSQLNGNSALAVLLTVVTNTLSVFTMSPLLSLLASFNSDGSLSIGSVVLKLLLTVLVPIIVGKAFRLVQRVRQVVTRFDTLLKFVSMSLLILIPWMKISNAKQSGSFSSISVVNIVSIIGFAVALHFSFLIINTMASFLFVLSKEARKAIIILASQKTLAIALSVLSYLPASVGDKGLLTIPVIISHMSQIIVDAFIVSLWLRYESDKHKTTDKMEMRIIEEQMESETLVDEEETRFIAEEEIEKVVDSKWV